MIVISTNISTKRKIVIGNVEVETGMYKTPITDGIYLTKYGVENDAVIDKRYHGGEDMACYIFGRNNYAYFKNLYPNAEWELGMFGENLEVDYLNESELNIGDIYRLGEAIIQIAQPRLPCSKFGYRLGSIDAIKSFADAPYPGVYVRVLQDGRVKNGDNLNLMVSQNQKLSLLDLYKVLLNKSKFKDRFESIINNPFVPEKCKLKLIA